MSALDSVLSRLPAARSSSNGYVARCLSHDDNQASLSIRADDDGKLLLHCFAGCSFEQIVALSG